jgi:hypothetical protein
MLESYAIQACVGNTVRSSGGVVAMSRALARLPVLNGRVSHTSHHTNHRQLSKNGNADKHSTTQLTRHMD